ncbi:peptidase C14 [Trametes polyzona]|nr:peptidase C14 [Trametes polyzona]
MSEELTMDILGVESRTAKAVLVGVRDIPGIPSLESAKGSHRDVARLRSLLIDVYGYRPGDITVLVDDPEVYGTDTEASARLWPTKENILREMKRLVDGACPGDRRVFQYSGHGGQIVALNDPNEKDGLDERQSSDPVIPFSNYVKDDATFMGLAPGAQCVMIFDCCHSGTAADLPDVTDDELTSFDLPLRPPPPFQSTGYAKLQTIHRDGPIISNGLTHNGYKLNGSDELALLSPVPILTSWSACADANNTIGNKKGGVFLRALCEALKKDPCPTHAKLLEDIHMEIEELMNRLPSDLKEGLHLPMPQLGSLRPHIVLETVFTL